MKYIYPAIFTWHEDEKVYLVNFPDLEGCLTFGYTLPETLAHAKDALTLMLCGAEDDKIPIPKSSKLEDIKLEDKNSFVQYVFADTELYRELLQLRKILDIKKRLKAKKLRKTA